MVREATRTPLTTLKELQAAAAELRETVQTTVLAKLYGSVAMGKLLLKKTHI